MNETPVIETKGLSIGYPHSRHPARIVASGINAVLRPGWFACLLGPNGAGETTLIRTLTGMQPPLAGTIRFQGKPLQGFSLRELAHHMSLVLTDKAAVGMMAVRTLVSLGRYPFTDWTGRFRGEDHTAVEGAMRAVGILDLAHRPVCELSDGERQKVMIARALAQEPRVMVLDEATAFLDLPRRVELMHLLRELAHSSERAVLLSTHDLDLALRCADQLWLLPPGGPLHMGAPEDLVLRDTFSTAFSGPGVFFDKAAGAFRLNGAKKGNIGLKGGGIAGVWTLRALERAGYSVVPEDETAVCVEVDEQTGITEWRIRGGSVRHRSLESLLADPCLADTPSEGVDGG
ncbi:MAG: ABC transporter ATP-binding protein [Deltaproteobacteria bacterium]|nr:ABC transporter ATP-binding protein [Deltaproteobacteria bacterium]